MAQTLVTLPLTARIPPEWVRRTTLYSVVMVFPGWGTGTGSPISYEVTLDLETRALSCSCDGFKYRTACHHVHGLRWAMCKPRSSRGPAPGVADTSLSAYRAFTPDDLATRQRAVYDLLRMGGPLSNREISERLTWPINCVVGRCHELRQMGVVGEAEYMIDPITGKTVHRWKVVEE